MHCSQNTKKTDILLDYNFIDKHMLIVPLPKTCEALCTEED